MNPLDRTCDAFLDNRMSEAERARFEMRVVREPRLAAVVDLHREVGSSLRRSFETPDLSGLIGKIEAAAAQMRAGGCDAIEGTIRWAAAVATLLFMLLALCASSMIASPSGAGADGQTMRGFGSTFTEAMGLSLATVSAVVASGVKLRRGRHGRLELNRFGSRLGADVALPEGTTVLRTERGSILGAGCTVVAYPTPSADAAPVALIVMSRDDDPRPDLAPARDGLRFFRRELGDVVLYERTYANRPELLFGCDALQAFALA
jgi:hypothetical protein